MKFILLFKKNQLLFQAFSLIILNYFITKYFYRALPSSESLYAQSSIFYNLYTYASLSLILFMLSPIFLYKLKWQEIIDKEFSLIKYFILFIFSIYAWGIITLDYNLYFNQAYHGDRIILLTLFVLSFRFPLAFIYFIILSLIFLNQVSYPSFGLKFPEAYVYIKPLLEVSILFIIFMFLKKIYKKLSILAFFIVVLCFHASNYFIPGLGKMLISEHYIDWIWLNDLGNILMAKYSQGWLSEFVALETMEVIIGWVSTVTIPMQLFALTIQAVVLFVFIKKRFAIILFVSFELLHLGIFMATGIFFWKWILLNFAIIYVVKNLNPDDIKRVFNYKVMLFAMPFIMFGYGFFHSYWLAWYDTPLHSYNQIYATTEDGERYEIDINLFAPYDRVFYRNTLNCFIDRPIKGNWDTNNKNIMRELTSLSKEKDYSDIKKQIYNFEKEYGQNDFNQLEQEKFINFLKTSFKNLNTYKDNKIIWTDFSPMRNMYRLFNWKVALNLNSDITQIEIVSNKKFYNYHHNKLLTLEKESIVQIKIE